ncbi:MAG: hypothetical protein II875_11910 [Clostridia bacterium]|nr:hypothetical protein [Clostridia bacterium]
MSRSSSYEAAKEAYNRALAAQETAAKALSNTEIIVGTQTAATGAWTGLASFSSLDDGQQIVYWLPYAGSGNASLNLTLANGNTTGAIPCYYSGASRITTHYAAGNAIHLTYRVNANVNGTNYTGWWADANYNTNTNTYNCIKFDNYTWSKKAIPAGSIVVGDKDGYEPIAGGVSFSVNLPILYHISALAKSKRDADFYLCYPSISLPTVTGDSAFTLLSRHTVYVAGRLNGETYTVLTENWLTDNPDDTTGTIVYIALGRMSTAASAAASANTSMYLYPEHPMYRMIGGVLTAVSQIAYEARLEAESAQESADTNARSIQRLDQSVSGLSTQFNVFSSGIEATIEDHNEILSAMSFSTDGLKIQMSGSIYYTLTDDVGYHIYQNDKEIAAFSEGKGSMEQLQMGSIICRKTSRGGWVWTEAGS